MAELTSKMDELEAELKAEMAALYPDIPEIEWPDIPTFCSTKEPW
jgi:hypothetical protein